MNGGVIWSNAAAVFDKSIMGGAIQLKANKNSLVVGLVGPLRWKEGGGVQSDPQVHQHFLNLFSYFDILDHFLVLKWESGMDH